MFIVFNCEHCGAKLETDVSDCGSMIGCPQCHTNVTIPHKGPGPGATVGGFKILQSLGKGGMGEVFLARQLSMDRNVALKILPKGMTADREDVDRFVNEVRLSARLDHPNIVTAYEAGQDAGTYFLAMAYAPGETLESRLKRTGPMPEAAALGIARKVAAALAYAWGAHHLIHRDVKPANIMLNDNDEPKLMDMGISKRFGDIGGLTLDGTVVGTPNYMSPEQADGLPNVDFRSDMYALGATLYHTVTGHLPFAGNTLMETLRKQATASLPDPRRGGVSLSRSCVLVMETLLARNPEQRYVTWEAFLAEADVVLSGGVLKRNGLPAGASALALDPPSTRSWNMKSGRKNAARTPAVPAYSASQSLPPAAVREDKPRSVALFVAVAMAAALALAVGLWVRFGTGGRKTDDRSAVRTPTPAPSAPSIVRLQPVPSVAPRPSEAVVPPLTPPASAPPPLAPDAGRIVAVPPPPPPPGAVRAPSDSIQEAKPPVTPPPPRVNVKDQLCAAADKLLCKDAAGALAALESIERMTLDGQETEMRELLRRAARVKETVLESLKMDCGKELDVLLKTGSEHFQLVSVDGDTIKARRPFKGGGSIAAWVDRAFVYADVSVPERIRRVAGGKEGDRRAMQALLAIESGKGDEARQYLAQADSPFGRLLAERWTALWKSAAEQEPAAQP